MGLKGRSKLGAGERWVKALSEMSKSTRMTYTRELKEFLEWANETPEGLIAFWVDTRDMSLSDHIREYVDELNELGFRGGKQNSAVKALKKFFKVNGFTPVFDVKLLVGDGGVRPAKADEIEKVLRFVITNPRETAIIAICKDSALRVSDITRIQFKHIQPIIDNPDIEFYGFQMPVWKTRSKKRQALPCFGLEAIIHLKAWLDTRARLGLTSNAEDYVFVNKRSVDEYQTKNQDRRAAVLGDRMDDRNASVSIIKLFRRAGFTDLSSTSLRKFNTTKLSLDGMPESLIKAMQGKHQQSSTDNYLKATANQMLEVFEKHYQCLTVDGQTELANKTKAVQEENEMLRNELTQSNILMKAILDNLGITKEQILAQ